MKQKIFFLHSAGSQINHQGSSDFLDRLINELGPNYEVAHPIMPNPEDPDYEPWKKQLDKDLTSLDGDVILVGHSLGGAVLLKYLTEKKINANVKAMFLCATPFWGADADWQYEPFTLPDNFVDLLPKIPSFFLYHSKQDPYVPFAHFKLYESTLPRVTSREIEGDSHAFSEGLPQ